MTCIRVRRASLVIHELRHDFQIQIHRPSPGLRATRVGRQNQVVDSWEISASVAVGKGVIASSALVCRPVGTSILATCD